MQLEVHAEFSQELGWPRNLYTVYVHILLENACTS